VQIVPGGKEYALGGRISGTVSASPALVFATRFYWWRWLNSSGQVNEISFFVATIGFAFVTTDFAFAAAGSSVSYQVSSLTEK